MILLPILQYPGEGIVMVGWEISKNKVKRSDS